MTDSPPPDDSGLPRVWALADTHLGLGIGKTMDRFGPHWINHPAKLRENVRRTVGPNDILLLPGDLSWATKRADAAPDLHLLAAFPGTKIAIKGNHDFWWDSNKPVEFPGLLSPPWRSVDGALGIAGTRGWFVPNPGDENESADRRILERERARLHQELKAIADCRVKIVMLHYPPHPYLAELRDAGVAAVVYGHIHLGSLPEDEVMAVADAELEGVRCLCVAADRIDFTPKRIL